MANRNMRVQTKTLLYFDLFCKRSQMKSELAIHLFFVYLFISSKNKSRRYKAGQYSDINQITQTIGILRSP